MERRKRQLLAELVGDFERELQPTIISEIRSSLDAGEYGVGFELLCNMLFEFSINLSRAQYEKIVTLGESMDLPRTEWSFLEARVTR